MNTTFTHHLVPTHQLRTHDQGRPVRTAVAGTQRRMRVSALAAVANPSVQRVDTWHLLDDVIRQLTAVHGERRATRRAIDAHTELAQPVHQVLNRATLHRGVTSQLGFTRDQRCERRQKAYGRAAIADEERLLRGAQA
jgi:arginine decarboxylase